MDAIFFGVIGLFLDLKHIRCVKNQKRNFGLLERKTEYFYRVRDAVKEEINKELMWGRIPLRELRTWLDEEEAIEKEVKAILEDKRNNRNQVGSCFDVSLPMKLGERMVTLLDEINDHLKKLSFQPAVDAPFTLSFQPAVDAPFTLSFQPVVDKPSIEAVKFPSRGKLKEKILVELSGKADDKMVDAPRTLRNPKEITKTKAVCEPVKEAKLTHIRSKKSESKGVPGVEADTSSAALTVKSMSISEHQKLSIAEKKDEMPAQVRESRLGPVAELDGKMHLISVGDEELPLQVPESVSSVPVPTPVPTTKPELQLHRIRRSSSESKTSSHEVEDNGIPHQWKDRAIPSPIKNTERSIDHTLKSLENLIDMKTQRIGIYGRGGIGKTTFLKALKNCLEMKSIFDDVIWVTISKYWSPRMIQNEVAQQLSVHLLNTETDDEVAARLFKLLNRRKFLLLLDDVWERIDFDALGIPGPNLQNGCTVVMATRSLNVCQSMGADELMEMKVISREESWELFREQVGEVIDYPNIQPFARAIVEECGGLPLVLIVTGRALRKENDVLVWRRALRQFLLPTAFEENDIETVVQKLKFCYDQLKADDVKGCFLYCALYPGGHEISISELIKCCICEGIITGNLVVAHKKGHDIVKDLLDASLLDSTDGGLSVRMHDVIRDLALWIISPKMEGCQFLVRDDVKLVEPEQGKIFQRNYPLSRAHESTKRSLSSLCEGHRFLSRAGVGLRQPPPIGEWEQAEMIFLMDNELTMLPESLRCDRLLMLFLQRNDRLKTIPISFFDHMPYLEVLNLSETRIMSLPPSLSKLVNLRVFVLRGCQHLVSLPSEVGELKHLEMLDLQGTEIYGLPDGIGKLTCLRNLQVSFYGSVNHGENVKFSLTLLSPRIISKLFGLKTLSINVDPEDCRWINAAQNITEDVSSLHSLTTLHFFFPKLEFLKFYIQTSSSWKNKCLKKFRFIVGPHVNHFVSRVPVDTESEYEQRDQCLRFVNGDEMIPEEVMEVLTRARAFYLDHHCKVYSLSEFGITNINTLEFCIVRECPNVLTIVDGANVVECVLPLLEHLSIHYLWSLTSICKGLVPTGSFERLKFLLIQTCPELSCIFAVGMLQHFSCLEELVVEDCAALKELIVEGEIMDYDIIILPRLNKLSLRYLPELISIWGGTLHSLEHISIYNCPNLKKLCTVTNNLKEIKAEKEWWDASVREEITLLRHEKLFSPILD